MSKKRNPKRRKDKRDMNPNNNANWKIVCSLCGTEWFDTEVIQLVGSHWEQDHPEHETPAFNLIWIGIGLPPKSRSKQDADEA